jgi:hypothetical protein
MALALAVIGVLVGIALGLRFKFLILVPAIASAVIFALILGLARDESFGSIVLAIVMAWSAIQLGYFLGIFFRKRIQ